jgi:hypothetical protein
MGVRRVCGRVVFAPDRVAIGREGGVVGAGSVEERTALRRPVDGRRSIGGSIGGIDVRVVDHASVGMGARTRRVAGSSVRFLPWLGDDPGGVLDGSRVEWSARVDAQVTEVARDPAAAERHGHGKDSPRTVSRSRPRHLRFPSGPHGSLPWPPRVD